MTSLFYKITPGADWELATQHLSLVSYDLVSRVLIKLFIMQYGSFKSSFIAVVSIFNAGIKSHILQGQCTANQPVSMMVKDIDIVAERLRFDSQALLKRTLSSTVRYGCNVSVLPECLAKAIGPTTRRNYGVIPLV